MTSSGYAPWTQSSFKVYWDLAAFLALPIQFYSELCSRRLRPTVAFLRTERVDGYSFLHFTYASKFAGVVMHLLSFEGL